MLIIAFRCGGKKKQNLKCWSVVSEKSTLSSLMVIVSYVFLMLQPTCKYTKYCLFYTYIIHNRILLVSLQKAKQQGFISVFS